MALAVLSVSTMKPEPLSSSGLLDDAEWNTLEQLKRCANTPTDGSQKCMNVFKIISTFYCLCIIGTDSIGVNLPEVWEQDQTSCTPLIYRAVHSQYVHILDTKQPKKIRHFPHVKDTYSVS